MDDLRGNTDPRFTKEKGQAGNLVDPTSFFPDAGSIRNYLKATFYPRTAAEKSNTWQITAWAYEPFWRRFSTSILTRGAWNLKKECRLVCDMLEPENGGIYLDVGCSTGIYARAIAMEKPESRIVLVDYSLPMLSKARGYAGKSLNQMAFVQCDAAEMPFPDDSFDGLVMGGTLNELKEPVRVLCEMARILKYGKTAVVMHLVKHRKEETLMQKIIKKGGVWLAGADDMDQMFREAGFTILNSKMEGIMRLSLLTPDSTRYVLQPETDPTWSHC